MATDVQKKFVRRIPGSQMCMSPLWPNLTQLKRQYLAAYTMADISIYRVRIRQLRQRPKEKEG